MECAIIVNIGKKKSFPLIEFHKNGNVTTMRLVRPEASSLVQLWFGET